MDDVRVCELCGTLFKYSIGPELCKECLGKTEKKLHEIRDDMERDPGLTLSQLSEAHDIPLPFLKNWVYEERIKFSEPKSSEVVCKACKKPIGCGKYCEDCKTDLLIGFAPAEEKREMPDMKGKIRRSRNRW